MNKDASNNVKTRRKVLLGLGILSLFPFLRPGFFSKIKNITASKKSKKETSVFLTQDGKLVQIADMSKIDFSQKKVSDNELQDWVKSNK